MQETGASLEERNIPVDRQLLRSALLADQDGILSATRLRLTRLAQARGVETHAIDDVVQETLLEAWRHLDRLHTPAGFRSWIDEICRNICRRAARRHTLDSRRYSRLLQPAALNEDGNGNITTELLAADTPDPLEELSRQDMVVLLDRALGELPPTTRQLMEMCYLLELPHAEMAARLGLSSGALDVRLHRARRRLRQVLHGPLRREAESLGLTLDATLAEGWQTTRLWCPLCACHRLEGCFLQPEAEEGPTIHLRCPHCVRLYHQDVVHSMGLIRLTGLRAFRPAWKRTMQGLTDSIVRGLLHSQHPCVYCGQPALIRVEGNDTAALPPILVSSKAQPYPFWISMHCLQCGNYFDARGNLPSIDQLVYWSHPRSREFVQQHARWNSAPARSVEYAGTPALLFQIADVESSKQLTILADRQTLQVLEIT